MKVIFILLLLVFARNVDTFSKEMNDMYIGRLEDFSKSGVVALHFPCKESNMFSTNCACHIKCKSAKCENAIDVCTKYKLTHKCQFVLLRGGKMNKFATLKRTPSDEERLKFSILEFSKPNSTYSSEKSRQSFNQLLANDPYARTMLTEIQNKVKEGLPEAMCGFQNSTQYLNQDFLANGITLVALSYHSPLTLANSMRTWNDSGLLDLMQERVAILSRPSLEEIHMSEAFGFHVVEPQNIPDSDQVKPNVFTIGAAFYYALANAKTEYVLFLENDFKIDSSLSKSTVLRELLAGAAMLQGGAELVRLLSRKTQGCGTFKDCAHGGVHLDATDPLERTRNWFTFYCPGHPNTESLVKDCLQRTSATVIPTYRCFTSWDSNWSLNAALVKRSTMMNKKYFASGAWKSIAKIGLSHAYQQDGFETDMMYASKWMNWRVPICISLEGLFIHEEIETSS